MVMLKLAQFQPICKTLGGSLNSFEESQSKVRLGSFIKVYSMAPGEVSLRVSPNLYGSLV